MSAVFQPDGDRRSHQTNEWRVHQVRVLRCREAGGSVGEKFSQTTICGLSLRTELSCLLIIFFPTFQISAAVFQQLGSNARCTWQHNMEIEAPGSSVYHRQRQNQTAKEVWNLERKLQIDEPSSGGRQACQVRVIVWRWNVRTSHNHIPACWLQLTTLFQSSEDCLELPPNAHEKGSAFPR